MTKHELTRKADERGRVSLGSEYANKDVSLTVQRSVSVDELPTMKAVHFFSPNNEVCARLYAGVEREDAEAVFGVHWERGPIWERSYYAELPNESAIQDYNAMEKASDGALVAAYYGAKANEIEDSNDIYDLNNHLVIGLCEPGSSIRAIPYEDEGGDVDFLKTLPLVDTVEVSRDSYEELFKNVTGHSVYETTKQEKLIRKAYRENRE